MNYFIQGIKNLMNVTVLFRIVLLPVFLLYFLLAFWFFISIFLLGIGIGVLMIVPFYALLIISLPILIIESIMEYGGRDFELARVTNFYASLYSKMFDVFDVVFKPLDWLFDSLDYVADRTICI